MRKYASAEERAAKNQKTTVSHSGFTEKVYGLPCTVRTMLLWKRHHRIECHRAYIFRFFTGRHSSGSSPKADCLCSSIYIYKEELKTVVCEFLACTQPNRHETSTALWTPYRRVSLRGRRAQIRFSRGARGEKTENDRPPFWFYGESIRTSVHGSHNVSCGSAIIGMPSCVFRFFYGAP